MAGVDRRDEECVSPGGLDIPWEDKVPKRVSQGGIVREMGGETDRSERVETSSRGPMKETLEEGLTGREVLGREGLKVTD